MNQDIPLTLSNSSISKFRQCPRSYYYDYVIKLPKKPKDYFILGTFVHEVLEIFYKTLIEDKSKNLASLMGECFKKTRQEHPEATVNILADAKSLLQNYLVRVIAKEPLPPKLEVENKFTIDIGGVKVTGIIDRIDFKEDGSVDVVDYKTGKKAKSAKDFENDLQLPIYGTAVKQLYNIPIEKISCKLDHLKVKTAQNLTLTEETLAKAERIIVESYHAIQDHYRTMEEDKWSEVGPSAVEKIKEYKEWNKDLESKFIIFITRFSKYWDQKSGWYCNYCDNQKICKNILW